ncbi:branched-chain amino acid transaminase [Daejeonella oryzae]|uniref:branched-chain amino acid transaminase n=1 Tax=Daejeonella oryzae TaxID=1122943 RepID=UPI00041DB893|nr:branched-chain amino acid transaminase [Daejeonella oryzae]
MNYYNDQTLIYLNGEFVKAAKATTDLYGQSLHYGYAVFEGIRAYNTQNGPRIFKADEHYERLKKSCELVHIPYPFIKEELIDATYSILSKNKLKDAYIRPLVYCGPNMSLTRAEQVNIMICAWEWGAYLGDKQIRACVSSFERPNPKSIMVEAKVSGHYVNSIMATSEAKSKGFDEAILLDMKGFVAEAPGANIFIEKDGRLLTPPKGNILPGITRETVFEICRSLEIEVAEQHFTAEDLKSADSAFLCGTAAEIIGIASIDDEIYPLSWHESLGSVIQQHYKNLVIEKDNFGVII